MNPTKSLQTYIEQLNTFRGVTVDETSRYGILAQLLNEVGAQLKPKVDARIHPKDIGAGIPDLGLFSDNQAGDDAMPGHGAIEVKPTGDDVNQVARSEQVQRYLERYGLVLVTNYFQFVLVTRNQHGRPVFEEGYQLAGDESAFWMAAALNPRKLARAHGDALAEYLQRVMLRNAPLAEPRDVAQMLASYARAARKRIEREDVDLSALRQVRTQLEQALGLQFDTETGEDFFRSSLVQTLFYGIFSAWVLWHESDPPPGAAFDLWNDVRRLNVPVISELFSQITAPHQLRPLDIQDILEWTAHALNRVERAAFFDRFERGEAVQYFYEPFLEAFDPGLRKQLGVWYTPPEVVDYMVARVDDALRDELGYADGLADPNVYVLDPCCGTGAYLVAVLRRIYARMRDREGEWLAGQAVAQAIRQRVFGFEILPAPFVVAHIYPLSPKDR